MNKDEQEEFGVLVEVFVDMINRMSGQSTGTALEAVKSNSESIAILNDKLRIKGEGGLTYVSDGVAKKIEDGIDVMGVVRSFSVFTEDNNPYGERDFGGFEVEGQKYFWKIDYFDEDLKGSAPDYTDPKTKRILTVALAEEY